MANDDHIALLKKGVDAWNAWRQENPDIRPDLRRARLRAANLSSADRKGGYIKYPDFRRMDLRGANPSGADLRFANLSGADLSEGNLSRTSLIGAILSEANLTGAELDNSVSFFDAPTDFRRADLSGASLHGDA